MPKKAGKNGTTPVPTNGDDHLRIEGSLLWKYRALSAEYDKIQLDYKTTLEKIEAFVAKTPEIKELFAKRTELMNQSSVAMKDLAEVQNEIGETLGVNLQDCSIDDKTGIIHVLKNGEQVPMSPPKVPVVEKKAKKRKAGSAARV